MHREGVFEHHRVDSVTMVMASLAGLVQGQAFLGPVPQGYAWYVENFASLVKGNSHTANCWFAATVDDGPLGGPQSGLAAWDGQGLLVPLSAGIANWWSGEPGYVGPGHVLHVLASAAQGGTVVAGDIVTATVQIAVHQLDPLIFMSPEDQQQAHQAVHGRVGPNEDADVATAGRRAT